MGMDAIAGSVELGFRLMEPTGKRDFHVTITILQQ